MSEAIARIIKEEEDRIWRREYRRAARDFYRVTRVPKAEQHRAEAEADERAWAKGDK